MAVYRDHNQIKIYLVFAQANVKSYMHWTHFAKIKETKRVVVATDTSYESH